MEIIITEHAKERMKQYDITDDLLEDALENPDSIIEVYGDRKLYQKSIDANYLLRIIAEESEGIKIIITVYKAKRGRYEIQI